MWMIIARPTLQQQQKHIDECKIRKKRKYNGGKNMMGECWTSDRMYLWLSAMKQDNSSRDWSPEEKKFNISIALLPTHFMYTWIVDLFIFLIETDLTITSVRNGMNPFAGAHYVAQAADIESEGFPFICTSVCVFCHPVDTIHYAINYSNVYVYSFRWLFIQSTPGTNTCHTNTAVAPTYQSVLSLAACNNDTHTHRPLMVSSFP